MCAARWCSHPSPSQAGSWFWEQSPAWLHFHLNSFPLQDRVLISRLSMETIPPVVFAPELVSGEHELAGPKWSRGTIVRVHQNRFRGPTTFPWCIDKNQFLWGKWFYRDEIWVNPAFWLLEKVCFSSGAIHMAFSGHLQYMFSDKRIHFYFWGVFVCFGGVFTSVESHSFQNFYQRLSFPTFSTWFSCCCWEVELLQSGKLGVVLQYL